MAQLLNTEEASKRITSFKKGVNKGVKALVAKVNGVPDSEIQLNTEKVSSIKLSKGLVGLGWDPELKPGADEFDADASAFLLKGGKLKAAEDVVFFNNTTGKGVSHSGDNLTGKGDGDDEQITIEFDKLDPEVDEVLIFINIYDGSKRNQNFGMIQNCKAHLDIDGATVATYDLEEDSSEFTSMQMCKLYKKSGEWKFKALGLGGTDTVGSMKDKLK